uniref:Elongation factor G, mitochondrial n=1 Tax=Arcella intermedia TaxID=1963864 RepID=A0A6B2KYZ3_9EUKA
MALLRNIGISAHIDSGKTTLTERILFFTGRIEAIHEVRGKDGVGAKMDSMDLEREKGITIKSAATHVGWKGNFINIIDTPGHVDFTIEVERSLHVLDGAILVVCGVSGVQSQTMTVDRQMKRYGVPRIIFINKLDRLGADPWKALKNLKLKLGVNCAAVQIPLGLQQSHNGVVDIITRETLTFEGDNGEEVDRSEVPERLKPIVEEKRQQLIESLADVDDEIAMKFLEGEEITVPDLKAAIRRATIGRKFIPVFMGSAFKNKGVQPLLDGVIDYLPCPLDREIHCFDKAKDGEKVKLEIEPKLPLVAYAFKIDEHKYGQLTWLRIYQGTLKKGGQIFNVNLNSPSKVPRLARMHAADLEDINEIRAGDICAMFGVDCASGETFTDGSTKYQMTPMHVPEAVISLSVEPKTKAQIQTFTRALKRFQREDPTFRVSKDAETNETLISGMGELHLEIYIERMKREYDLPLNIGKPRVNFRETITSDGKFDYTHKKQSGGAGQYAKIVGRLEPINEEEVVDGQPMLREFVNSVLGNSIPPNYIPAIEKGYEDCLEKGPLIGHPIERVRMILLDGAHHAVDSSEYAFRICTHAAFREGFMRGNPGLLEPVMSVEVTAPTEFQPSLVTLINKRRGQVSNSTIDGTTVVVEADVPLALMFGFSTDLRSITEGKGEFAMVYKNHSLVPRDRLDGIIEEYKRKAEKDAKRDAKDKW